MKLISCNIERHRHLDRIEDLLREEAPDVVCLQEVCITDLPTLAAVLDMESRFAPMFFEPKYQCNKGVAILAHAFDSFQSTHFAGADLAPKTVDPRDTDEREFQGCAYKLLTAEIVHEGEVFRVNTTHLPVTTEGKVTWFQLQAIDKLLALLSSQSELILCGDTNAPRGREAFARIAERYIDHIPAEYPTSIDGDLHRAGSIPFMVDGFFSTPGYRTERVRLVSGVSDHCAIVADVFVS
jgi:endonuclease/exonuclease/phosphatase family metal-dependent hydrolase